jgi:hypothetical protein
LSTIFPSILTVGSPFLLLLISFILHIFQANPIYPLSSAIPQVIIIAAAQSPADPARSQQDRAATAVSSKHQDLHSNVNPELYQFILGYQPNPLSPELSPSTALPDTVESNTNMGTFSFTW